MDEPSCECVFVRSKLGVLSEVIVDRNSKNEVKHVRVRPGQKMASVTLQPTYVSEIKSYNHDGRLMPLFQCCISFVAVHIEMVESFCSFPEDLAKYIWLHHLKIEKTRTALPVLQTFCDAFPCQFLPAASISSLHVLNNYELEFEILFAAITALDLGGCQLGDAHDLLKQVHTFSRLKTLNLSRNNITIQGIKNMVNPTRLKCGFQLLEYLDLSENVLSAGNPSHILSLAKLPNLESLILSADGTIAKKMDVILWNAKFRRTSSDAEMINVETLGWAKPLLDSWHEAMLEKLQLVPQVKHNFYGKNIVSSRTANAFGTTNNRLCIYKRLGLSYPANKMSKLMQEFPTDDLNLHNFEKEMLTMYNTAVTDK